MKFHLSGKGSFSFLSFIILITVQIYYSNITFSAPLKNVPQTLIQPNGEVLHCFASGDEFYNRLHDKDNYTIVQDPKTGYYVYADKVNGELVPTASVAGRTDPARIGLAKGLMDSLEKIQAARQQILQQGTQRIQSVIPSRTASNNTGTLNNIVIFIRFSDENEFTDSRSYYADMFNTQSPGVNSMYNYYKEVSYGQLSVVTYFYPSASGNSIISYKDSHPRNYYRPYNEVTNPEGYQGGNDGAEIQEREHTLLANAVNAVGSQIPGSLNVDHDNDGYVDNICFIVSGSPDGWSSLLWPHKWSLFSQSLFINGKRIWTYNFQLQAVTDNGVLCHEMFHSLGAPDLYHYNSSSYSPIGAWDIMDGGVNPPEHMSSYMKYKYGGWIASIPEITRSGTYTLNSLLSSSNNCFKIKSPNSASEYYVVEYRKRTGGFETSLPGEGLLVYRIDPSMEGNADGPPDEVYLFRPMGSSDYDGNLNDAAFSRNAGRTSMNDLSDPNAFLSDGSNGGLCITNVGITGSTISFNVIMDGTAAVTLSGKVTDNGRNPVSGVSMIGLPGNVVTDMNGLYSAQVPAGWTGTVTPSRSGYTFASSQMSYSKIVRDYLNENYTGTLQQTASIKAQSALLTVSGTEGTLIPVTIKIGDPFPVASPGDLSGVSFRLNWGTSGIVELDSYSAGPFMGSSPIAIVQGFPDHAEAGLSVSGPAVTGSGVAVVCTLKVLKTLSLPVNLKITLSDISAVQSSGLPLTLSVPYVTANVHAMLQGPYSSISGNMSTSLKDNSYLPLAQPYSSAPYNYMGNESVAAIPEGVVDWVMAELRTGTASDTKTAQRAGFIKKDGTITDLDGTSPLKFEGIAPGNYYIVINHRNHMSVMSSAAAALSESSALYDFTQSSSNAYGTNPMKDIKGDGSLWAMYTGKATANTVTVGFMDRTAVRNITGFNALNHYGQPDLNMDGILNFADRTLVRANTGISSKVPQ